MSKQKNNDDNKPVSRNCLRKLVEIAAPMMVILIVAQITTTFFIVKYLPKNSESLPASVVHELDEIQTQIEDLNEGQQADESRNPERDETQEEPEPAQTNTQNTIHTISIPAPTAKTTGDHASATTDNGLVRVRDESCPSGYALMNARLEKSCE